MPATSAFLRSVYPLMRGAGAVLPRYAAERSAQRLPRHQPLAVARKIAWSWRRAVRRADDGHGDPARPVRPDERGREDPRHRRRAGRAKCAPPAPGCAVPDRRGRGSCRNGRRLGRRRARTAPPPCLASLWPVSRATRSISTATPALAAAARRSRSKSAAIMRPAGRPRGASTCGRGCATATTLTTSCASCSGRSAPIPTCSTRTRRSRSTAISAALRASSRC